MDSKGFLDELIIKKYNFNYIKVFPASLLIVNDAGCWLLLASTVVGINICLVVIPSYRNDVGLWDFALLFLLDFF